VITPKLWPILLMRSRSWRESTVTSTSSPTSTTFQIRSTGRDSILLQAWQPSSSDRLEKTKRERLCARGRSTGRSSSIVSAMTPRKTECSSMPLKASWRTEDEISP
ncbi:hypothetical protein PMAYCL1PPCAC_08276, partial [Pristionchus mayeri]